jgi:hypothetical protein
MGIVGAVMESMKAAAAAMGTVNPWRFVAEIDEISIERRGLAGVGVRQPLEPPSMAPVGRAGTDPL